MCSLRGRGRGQTIPARGKRAPEPTRRAGSGPWDSSCIVTYRQDLTTRDSTKCRRLIESAMLINRTGARASAAADRNQRRVFENDMGGYRFSGTMTLVTVWGGNIIIYDDPHDVLEVDSSAQREEVIPSGREHLPNRLNR